MAIDGLGGSTPPLTPPADLNDDTGSPSSPGTTGVAGTSGTPGAAAVGGTPPEAPPVVNAPNVPPPPISVPKPNSTPLDRPKLVLPSQATSLSVGDLIQLIQAEIQKTSEALAQAQNSAIKQDSLRQQAANTSQIAALKDAAEQIIEIQKEQEAMEIAKWCMFAIALFITVSTAGTLGAIGGPLMVAATVCMQVPIEGKDFSGWLTEGMGEGIGQLQKAVLKQALKDRGITPTQEAMDKFNEEIENNQDYYAMAILIALEVTVAVVIAVATWGAGASTAATGGVAAVTETATAEAINIATKTVETATQEAAEVATKVAETAVKETTKAVEKAAQTALEQATKIAEKTAEKTIKEATDVTTKVAQTTIKSAAKAAESSTQSAAEGAAQLSKIQKAISITQTIGTTAKDLAMDGVSIHTAVLQYENSENLANADKIKAYVKFLQQILKSDQEFLKELIEMQSNIADTTKGILQTEHSTNLHIANLTTHA